jgi:hypothetical protein
MLGMHVSSSSLMLGAFFVVGSLANLFGTSLVAPIAGRIGKRQLYMIMMGLASVITIAFFFLRTARRDGDVRAADPGQPDHGPDRGPGLRHVRRRLRLLRVEDRTPFDGSRLRGVVVRAEDGLDRRRRRDRLHPGQLRLPGGRPAKRRDPDRPQAAGQLHSRHWQRPRHRAAAALLARRQAHEGDRERSSAQRRAIAEAAPAQ